MCVFACIYAQLGEHTCERQRTACRNQLCPSTTWLQVVRLRCCCPYSLSHLTGPTTYTSNLFPLRFPYRTIWHSLDLRQPPKSNQLAIWSYLDKAHFHSSLFIAPDSCIHSSLLFYNDRIFCIPDWPQIHYVAEVDPPVIFWTGITGMYHSIWLSAVLGTKPQGFLLARQVFYQLSHSLLSVSLSMSLMSVDWLPLSNCREFTPAHRETLKLCCLDLCSGEWTHPILDPSNTEARDTAQLSERNSLHLLTHGQQRESSGNPFF